MTTYIVWTRLSKMEINDEIIFAFSVLCQWIRKYDFKFNEFSQTHLGSFKRYYNKYFAVLDKFYFENKQANITIENLFQFFIFTMSLLSCDNLNFNIMIILEHILNNKFNIKNSSTSIDTTILLKLKKDLYAKYNKDVEINEKVFEEDDIISQLIASNQTVTSQDCVSQRTCIINDTQDVLASNDSNADTRIPSESQTANLLSSLASEETNLDKSTRAENESQSILELKQLVGSMILMNQQLVEENKRLNNKLDMINTKVSISNRDQDKAIYDFEQTYSKSLKYNNHLKIMKSHIDNKSFPACLSKHRFPTDRKSVV